MIDDSNDDGGRGNCWGVSAFKHSNDLMEHSLITFANKTARSAASEIVAVTVRSLLLLNPNRKQ